MTFRTLLRTTGELLMMLAQHKPGMFLRGPVEAAQTTTLTTEGNPTMNWLRIFNLLPVIAAGINVFHSGKPLADKQTLAQEALHLSVAGALAVAPPEEQSLITAVGVTAQNTLSALVENLHNNNTQPVVG